MPHPAQHPTDQSIAAFALGRCEPTVESSVEEHLRACEPCQARAEAVAPDTLVQLLAAAATRIDSDRSAASTPTLDGSATPSLHAATQMWHGVAAASGLADVPVALAGHSKYRAIRLLGTGGMGTVWLAQHEVMHRPVAVKVIRPDLLAKSGATGRFLREVRAAAKLHHPNIVTAFDAEPVGDSCLLVMEYIDGETLADRLKDGPMPATEACRAIRDAARGLAHAHAAGLVHRDVKPHNLIRAADGTVKVLDFGLAGVGAGEVIVAGGDGLTGAGMVVGTPDYIAPEQIADPHSADARADIYGLGCTFYHLLAGHSPVPQGSILEKLAAQESHTPDPIPGLAADLAAVLARMLAKKPEDRYQTAEEVVAALDTMCDSWRGGERPPRRHRRALAIATGLMFALALAFAAVVYKIQRDNEEITITTDDPDIEVVMKRKGEIVRIRDPKSGQTWELNTLTNEIGLMDQPDGLTLKLPEKEPFVLRRKGERVFSVARSPRAVPMPAAEPVGEVRRFEGHRDAVFAVAVSPDGKHILTGGGDNANGDCDLRLWDAQTGKRVRRFEGHQDGVHAVAFSPDGLRAISAGSDRTLRVWDVATAKQLACFEGHPGTIFAAAVSPDGRRALAGVAEAASGQLWVWDLETGKVVKKIKVPGQVFNAAFLPDGRHALSGDHTHVLRLWDLESGAETKSFQGHGGWVLGISLSSDAQRVLTSATDRTIRLWDMKSGAKLKLIDGHQDAVMRVLFTPDGRRALSCGMDRTLRLWDVASGDELHRFEGHTDRVNGIAFLPNSRLAVSVSSDKSVRLWRLPEPKPIKSDSELILGTWRGVEVEMGGQKMPQTILDMMKPTLNITADKVTGKGEGDGAKDYLNLLVKGGLLTPEAAANAEKGGEGIYHIDSAKSPKTIDFATIGGARKTAIGIYTLDGDTLKLCLSIDPEKVAVRPKEFATKAGEMRVIVTLKRQPVPKP